MSHKYIIRQKLEKGEYRYFTDNSFTGWDIRINESLVFEHQDDAINDALVMKRTLDGIEVIAVDVIIKPVRAKN